MKKSSPSQPKTPLTVQRKQSNDGLFDLEFTNPSDLIRTHDDHIYFYAEVNDRNALELNIKLQEHAQISARSLFNSMFEVNNPSPIWLHINSTGGSVTDAFSIVDTIDRIKSVVPVVTIIEGEACSAATFIALAGSRRLIRPNALVLIHQLSGGAWGNFEQLKDDFVNTDLMMKKIKQLYLSRTKLKEPNLSEMLKRDLYFDAKTAIKFGLADQII